MKYDEKKKNHVANILLPQSVIIFFPCNSERKTKTELRDTNNSQERDIDLKVWQNSEFWDKNSQLLLKFFICI